MTDQSVAESSEPLVATDTESAAERFQELLHPAEAQAKPEAEVEQTEVESGSNEPEGTEAAEAAPDENTDVEAEPEAEGESVEIPSTINDLAEQFGVDVNDLATHLTVKVDGEEIPLSDLRDGHMRKSDFSRRMQEVADAKQAVDAQSQQLQGQMSQRLQELDTLVLTLGQQASGEQVDLNQLLNDDPAEYVRAKARIDAQNQALQQAHNWRLQQQEDAKQERQKQLAAHHQKQQDLLVKKIPDFTDPQKSSEFEKDMATYLGADDFTPAQIKDFVDGPWDHRWIKYLRNSMKYEQLLAGEKSLKKKVHKLPKVVKPGSAEDKGSRKTDAKTDALSTMKRRGDDASAVNFMKNLLPD